MATNFETSLRGKRVLVVGLAQTGVSVARFCASRGASVTVTDAKSADLLADRVRQLDGCAALELGSHVLESFTGADYVLMSPGVPELPEMQAARDAGAEVIAEIELAYRCLHPEAQLIAITGTNGKSTTTALTGALCQAASDAGAPPTFCGGNLGNHPLIEAVDHPANTAGGFVVAEVAGFMLETCAGFRPNVAACLNITEDHLDRYGTMDVYASMKTRVYRWQRADDFAIANAHCARTLAGAQAAAGRVLVFDAEAPLPPGTCGAYLSPERDEIVLRPEADGPEHRFPAADLPLIGQHNLENAMAAYLAAHLVGVSDDAIRAGARSFRPQKHRMERVGEKGEVVFYDDSKGTNVAAVAASMRGFPRPAVLIAGGVDKGGSYAPMFEALRDVARGLVLIGEARPLIRAAASEAGAAYPVVDAESMEDAVRKAAALARAGDAVVLSPACSSYDMFRNFGERGMAFRDAVSAIGGRRLDIDTDLVSASEKGDA
ncbi:UDP-N-acetylmuramoyl-L-alanine--D-glutamate ligase [Haliangium ochraceum]|uniref:UDP-N-acetylmuramoylalanine--D-glutamate ligase n=1 Tax=Haliangium ochraceum (strain DSM 14365 / JCM 11303 / SMP-2) TaxID=502025 RepID=D0LZ32_HALO1|nr:UDP-N-acetylmuramoyl-L-alanine--D-glutamate ligase [Haliangium ochraceum]ACY14502.1 UDP-N-acetylmuramoylalanine/D-glutamate ligase [Haliangium ochraceum DSM 14365]